MSEEIKEIDLKKYFYLCSPLLNKECTKESCYINNGCCCHTVNKKYSQEHLLNYITDLQKENQSLKEKLNCKEYFSSTMPENTEFVILTKENYDKQQKDLALEYIGLREEKEDYKSRNEKAIKKLGKYKHYTTPTEEQNSKNEDIVDSAYNILKGGDE